MTRKIGIIGVGHVGAAIAHGLVVQGLVDELVLIDQNEAKVQAEALDFEDALANLSHHVNFTVNDWGALADADIVISTLGKISLQKTAPKGDRFIELQFTKHQIKDVAEHLVASQFKGILLVVTNPVDVITSLYQHFTGFAKERVIGTGTLLDTARLKRTVGQALQVDPRSVTGYNLGEHGNSQFTAWSTVRVKGQPVTNAGLDLAALEEEARRGGFTVYNGKEFTSYGIASAAIVLIQAVLTDSYTELPVSNYLHEYDIYASYPVIVGRAGVVDTVQLNLTVNEKTQLQASASYIKQRFDDVLAELND